MLSICLRVLYTCMSIHTSQGHPGMSSDYLSGISSSASPSIVCQKLYNCVGLSYQLINFTDGHMQCHVRLEWVPSIFWVMILVCCFSLLGLEATGCVLRLHAVDIYYHGLFFFVVFSSCPPATASTAIPSVMVVCLVLHLSL